MSTSQNGYKANDSSLIASYTVVDDVKLNLRKGDVSVVLLHFARWFHHNIEKLDKKSCGGYNPRFIEGSTTLSNHASGTAMDLNWAKHVMGKANTFSADKQKKIREQLKFYRGVIRWGGDYKNRKDDMHFEINAGPSAVASVVKKIKAESAPKPSAPVLKKGSRGQAVIHLQEFLRRVFPTYKNAVSVNHGKPLVVDGDFGDTTEAWVKEFQERTGLKKDGEVGPKTRAKLRSFGYQF